MTDMPPQVENQLRQYQEIQQQLQAIMAQRQQTELQVRELDRTLGALEDVDAGTPLFRSVGTLLVGVKDADKLRTELTDQKETLEVRQKSVKRQEDQLKERLTTLQGTLERLLGQAGGGEA